MNTTLLKTNVYVLFLLVLLAGEITRAQPKYTLKFPKLNFTVESLVVKTQGGDKRVTFLCYRHIPYVTNPVDKDYQSLDVYLPVKIAGNYMDANHAPILFVVGVGGYMSVNNASPALILDKRAQLALAAGYVVVAPGCRGRDNKTKEGIYYGKAPAAIVDLKAAVRYIRHNKGVIPGNTDWIVSVGCSAGGALSALLGTSVNSPLFNKYLKDLSAAPEGDDIFGSACFSPITDLDHADMAYEWMFGTLPAGSGAIDRELSTRLKEAFTQYQFPLNLKGKGNFGSLTSESYPNYLLQYYLFPSASQYIKNLPADERTEYLEKNKWITWKDNTASFSFRDYLAHVGRMKGLPAFDDFGLQQPEPSLFGNENTNARHFTNFSLRHTTGNPEAQIDDDLKTLVNMMNAMYFTGQDNSSCALHWWLRNGTSDNHTSQTIMINLATRLQNLSKDVNSWLFWDGGHCADNDPQGLIDWIGKITGYTR